MPRDCPTVAAALQQLSSWPATVLISAGIYHESLLIDKPVDIVGRGKVVFKTAEAQSAAVSCGGPGQASLQNLSFEGSGCGVEVTAGSLVMTHCTLSSEQGIVVKGVANASLQNCSFTGCRRAGCIVRDEAVGNFSNCCFEKNANVCLAVREQAKVNVTDCSLRRNAAPVLQFKDKAIVQVSRSCLQSNNGCGVLVRGQASACIEFCEILGHKMAAVAFQHDATGTLRGNTMRENDGAVVLISGKASVLVADNTLARNGKAAPVIEFSSASGTVRAKVASKREDSQNKLTHKLTYISGQSGEEWVDIDETQKILRNKTGETNIPYTVQQPMKAGRTDDGEGGTLNGASVARGTKRSVIAVRDAAHATIQDNRLENNDGYGILISEQATLVIQRNLLSGCRCSAIHMDGKSSASIVRNNFSNNHAAGIDMRDEASPTIEDNSFQGHKAMAIRVADKSTGVIRGNRLSDNACHAIVVSDFAKPCVEHNVIDAGKEPAMLLRSGLGTYTGNEVKVQAASNGGGKRRREPEAPRAEKKRACTNLAAVVMLTFRLRYCAIDCAFSPIFAMAPMAQGGPLQLWFCEASCPAEKITEMKGGWMWVIR